MIDWIKASYTGRIGRKHFAMLLLLLFVLTVVTMPIFGVFEQFGLFLGGLLSIVFGVVFNIFTMHIYVRRLHDLGLTGWLILLTFVPVVGPYVGLAMAAGLLFWPGNRDVNSYGVPPTPERTLRDVLWNP